MTVPAYNALHSADEVAAGHFRRYTLAHSDFCAGRVLSRSIQPIELCSLPPFVTSRDQIGGC